MTEPPLCQSFFQNGKNAPDAEAYLQRWLEALRQMADNSAAQRGGV